MFARLMDLRLGAHLPLQTGSEDGLYNNFVTFSVEYSIITILYMKKVRQDRMRSRLVTEVLRSDKWQG